jgi:hypothetical protein
MLSMKNARGYDWNSGKSNNAVEAEELGLYPISIAAKIVAKNTGLSISKCKNILQLLGSTEYHHTSKYYNVTYYYDTLAAIKVVDLGLSLGLPINDSFISAVKAYGLQDEDSPIDKLNNPGEYDSSLEEFIDDVNNNIWL